MTKINLRSRFKKNSQVITKKIGKKLVILDPIAGEIRSLNQTASFIWGNIQPRITVDEIIKRVCQKYEVSIEKAKKEVANFLDKYLKIGLIKPVK